MCDNEEESEEEEISDYDEYINTKKNEYDVIGMIVK